MITLILIKSGLIPSLLPELTYDAVVLWGSAGQPVGDERRNLHSVAVTGHTPENLHHGQRAAPPPAGNNDALHVWSRIATFKRLRLNSTEIQKEAEVLFMKSFTSINIEDVTDK